ncbi:MAG: hypothetical protein ACKVJS_05510 [Flavobacteriales bacterium]|jgi:hypothetical protein|tara:strand:+ start:1186 stop:1518 length:333 start_codon:yes stop_codon:yes gene_type:complete
MGSFFNKVTIIIIVILFLGTGFLFLYISQFNPSFEKKDKNTNYLTIKRISENPIIYSEMDQIFKNEKDVKGFTRISSPTLIRVPDWVKNPLGKYYLYFSHHQGDHKNGFQ